MRNVILTMTENEKYEIIKKVIETNGNKQTASLKIGCTRRHINRLIALDTSLTVNHFLSMVTIYISL